MRNIKNIIATSAVGAAIGVAALTGCSSLKTNKPHDERSEGRVTDDKHITKNVQEKLKEDGTYKFANVEVNTYAGIVQLSGFVNNPEQKRRAEDIARNVGGVSQVVSSLVLKPAPPPPLSPTGQGSPGQQQLSTPTSTTNSSSTTTP
jgi:osmotically-inducible protein OsmY